MDKAIKELLDLRAIEQLMIHYADRIDANDPEGAAACFAEDGIGKYWGDFRGRKEIAARLGKILKRFSTTSHHLSNVSIQLDGDRATAMSYVYAFHRMADTNDPMHYWAAGWTVWYGSRKAGVLRNGKSWESAASNRMMQDGTGNNPAIRAASCGNPFAVTSRYKRARGVLTHPSS